MGQFSVEKPVPPGSALSGNQHLGAFSVLFGLLGPDCPVAGIVVGIRMSGL